MTVLTATEYGAVNSAASDVDLHVFHVCRLVEEHTRIALTSSKEVTGDGVSTNLLQRARHTEGAARHRNGTLALYVGQLVTAINVGQDVAARDVHHGIASYRTSLRMPFARTIRHTTTTAAKHVAVEGMTVIGGRATAYRIISSCAIILVP